MNPRAGHPTYTLSRGAPSASWVLLHKLLKPYEILQAAAVKVNRFRKTAASLNAAVSVMLSRSWSGSEQSGLIRVLFIGTALL